MEASSFAEFIRGFISSEEHVVELGCGNGRDSRFLGQFNHVLGIDQSEEAINLCNTNYSGSSASGMMTFKTLSIEDESFVSVVKAEILKKNYESIFVYARFFLHAIDEFQYQKFWDFLEELKFDFFLSVGVEFRTNKDEVNIKYFPKHYRRYLDPSSVVDDAVVRGFKCEFFEQGFGYAKYKNEDPHVARIIFR